MLTLKSLEKFNMEERTWEEKAPMIHARIGLACAKYRNYIWVAGGLSGSNTHRTVLDSVESYNLRSNQ
ncbi:hypothetical protein NQ314_005941 [Rhamnusium bicolor]|uniref:Uncharacterized protein n=1 Tax=Rhamnusium bicolor TaxID=1586634 RepID=A0AAV8ZCH4_9CUCU|nr:hypothetical protein NQ314_005941 [Rhamnusium bicolor]